MLVTKHKASGDLQHQTVSLVGSIPWSGMVIWRAVWKRSTGGSWGVSSATGESASLCTTVRNWSLAVSIAPWWCKLSYHFKLRQWVCCHFSQEAWSWSGCLGERAERFWVWLNARGITTPSDVRTRRPVEALCSVHKQRIHLLETDLLNTFSSGVAATNGSLWSLRRVGSWSYKGDCRWAIRICTDKYFLKNRKQGESIGRRMRRAYAREQPRSSMCDFEW